MADPMVQAGIMSKAAFSAEDRLRAEIARSDRALSEIGPVLRSLLNPADRALFNDELLARVRGMVRHLARQLLTYVAEESGAHDPISEAEEHSPPLAELLSVNTRLLAHVHAHAIEWQLTDRLRSRAGLDPALSPLLQTLIASQDPATAETAMAALAAQVRFIQQGRRMELLLAELPAEIFHLALEALRDHAEDMVPDAAERASIRLRSEYDESRGRLGLLSRLVVGMGAKANEALAVEHAGVGLFLSALSLEAGQDRNVSVLCTTERHATRLALALKAAGLDDDLAAVQFGLIHPDAAPPTGLETVSAISAGAWLAAADPFGGM